MKPPPQNMGHTCHISYCSVSVPPALLMCRAHWKKVPAGLKAQVWKHYRRGQEVDKTPTQDYLDAARNAINAVEVLERGELHKAQGGLFD